MYVLFYVCRVIDFVDWLDKGLIIYEKCLEMCICLWPEFDCPEGTLCGWQDIKMQLLTDWTGLWAILYIMGSQRGPVCGRSCTSWAANVDRFVGNPIHHGQPTWTGLWAILYLMGSQRGPVCGRSCTSWAANVDWFVGDLVHHGQPTWTGLWAILYIMGSQRGPVCGKSYTSWAV